MTTVRSSDAGEHAGKARGWTMEFAQLSAGRFDGRLVDVQLDRLQILRDVANAALAKRGRVWDGAVLFNLPMNAEGDGRFAGRPLTFPACLVSDGRELPELCTPRSLDLACIAADRQWLLEMAETQGRDLAFRRLRTLRPRLYDCTPEMMRLKDAIANIFENLPFLSRAMDQDGSRSALESEIADLLLDALVADEGEPLHATPPQKKVADKARSFVLDHAEGQPTVDDICRHVGVSRRKLQNCFQDSFGFSPTQFLRITRLNGVRRDLRAARETAAAGPVSIGDIAARWGFWHWSRFSSEYRALFGELPSETLRRPRA
ncbi:helix-turn-helix domain-containing protein [Azospirillum sp. B510]|uniref:helix-turn-helix domain-containing protein n=1 Tax=Azospirillum sp. (strain B510) TaxID=137722 RepID=UPI00030EACA7|nr:helix-turn-helix domain-containing protein [Azospirillum sp. B510]